MNHKHIIHQVGNAILMSAFLFGSVSVQAALMQATVSGTVTSGYDAYNNTLNSGKYFSGPASITIVYDVELAGPSLASAPNWSFQHGPSYFDGFQGIVGESPIRSASFTFNGITLAMDVSGISERGYLTVSNPSGQNHDSYILGGADERYTWCPNDRQCAERVSVNAYQNSGDDLFGGQHNFSPADTFTILPAPGRTIEGYVRLLQSSACPAGLCPEGRFADTSTHWVEFIIGGPNAQLTVTSVPLPASGWLLFSGLSGIVMLKRKGKALSLRT